MIIAANNNIHIEPFIKITLQHPLTIALQLRSPQYPPFSPVGSLRAGFDDIFYAGGKMLTQDFHILAL